MWTPQSREAAEAVRRANEAGKLPAHQQGINRATYGAGAVWLVKALAGMGAGAASFIGKQSLARRGRR